MISKNLVASLLYVVVWAGTACADPPNPQARPQVQGQNDTDLISNAAYNITPAPAWKVLQQAIPSVDMTIITQRRHNFTPNLTVSVAAIKPEETLEIDKGQIPVFYPRMFTHFALRSEQILTTAQGDKELSLTATHDTGTPPVRLWMHQVFFIKGSNMYIFTCTALDASHSDYEKDFHTMLQSIRWTG